LVVSDLCFSISCVLFFRIPDHVWANDYVSFCSPVGHLAKSTVQVVIEAWIEMMERENDPGARGGLAGRLANHLRDTYADERLGGLETHWAVYVIERDNETGVVNCGPDVLPHFYHYSEILGLIFNVNKLISHE
jgi:hypothetical protein